MDLKAPSEDRPRVVWLSGLSGAGKSTLAEGLAFRLRAAGMSVARLDGDDLRQGLCADLGFCPESRAENLRRAAHVARLMSDAGLLVVCSFVTPFERDRRRIREILGPRLLDAFVHTSLAECERRDPKGLYRRARAGEIPEFTGVSSPFERPERPDLVLCTETRSVACLVGELAGRLNSPSPRREGPPRGGTQRRPAEVDWRPSSGGEGPGARGPEVVGSGSEEPGARVSERKDPEVEPPEPRSLSAA